MEPSKTTAAIVSARNGTELPVKDAQASQMALTAEVARARGKKMCIVDSATQEGMWMYHVPFVRVQVLFDYDGNLVSWVFGHRAYRTIEGSMLPQIRLKWY